MNCSSHCGKEQEKVLEEFLGFLGTSGNGAVASSEIIPEESSTLIVNESNPSPLEILKSYQENLI